MRTTRALLCGLAACAALAGPLQAEPAPSAWPVTPQAGDWFICAASFSGDLAPSLAEELSGIVRRDYKLAAYTWNRGGEERRKQQEQIDKLRALCPEGRFRMQRIEEQYVVLVGGYKDMKTAREALDQVKKLKPPPDKFGDKMVVSDGGAPGQGVLVNPFQRSFVVHNPLTPNTPPPADPNEDLDALREFNSGESFSLLKCGKPWTLVVKTYQGAPALVDARADTQTTWQKMFGGGQSQGLSAGAMQAHSVADALRKMGYESYVLHTRYQSIVAVGGYDSPSDARMQEAQRTLANLKLVPFEQLFPQPLPMQVPGKK